MQDAGVMAWLERLQDRSWRRRLDSTSALVERSILILLAVLRLGLVVQVALAAATIIATPAYSQVSAIIGIITCIFSIALVLRLLAEQKFNRAWIAADMVIAIAALIGTSLLDPPESFVGNWMHWAPGYALQVPVFFAGLGRSVKLTAIVGSGLGIVYAVCTIPGNSTLAPSIAINAISYPLFGVAASVFARYARRVATESDSNRASAIASATALELSNYRFHVHNASGLLARLGNPQVRPEELPALRRQALDEANRLRNEFLLSRPPAPPLPTEGTCTIGDVVWDATKGFGNLPLEMSIALGHHSTVKARQGLALSAALVSLLHNIQFYAQAKSVTVHADSSEGTWELVVRDDGIGFDPDPARFGFGLRDQVVASLEAHGMSVSIDSKIGGGACITITGPDLGMKTDRVSS